MAARRPLAKKSPVTTTTAAPAPAPTTGGPLHDWVARLEALASSMVGDPRVDVTFQRAEGIDEDTLAAIEASWKIDRLAPAIRNVYGRANGLCFLWIATHHPYYPLVREHRSERNAYLGGFSSEPRPFSRMPTPTQVDEHASFVWKGLDAPPHGSPVYGAIYLPPLEKVLGRRGGMFQTSFGSPRPERERTLLGKVWKGSSFEDALRVFDWPESYSPAAFVMEEGVADPPVVLAFDHTGWDEGPATTFERYLEHVLATLGLHQARRAYFLAGAGEPSPPLDLQSVLPPSIALVRGEGGATFEVTVAEVTAAAGDDVRVEKLRALIAGHRVKTVAKVLDLKPLNRNNELLLADIVARTSDPDSIDTKTAARLMAAALQKNKTKKDYLEAFAVGAGGGGGGGETLTLEVRTCFDRSAIDTGDVDGSFQGPCVQQWLVDLGMTKGAVAAAWTSSEVVKTRGRSAKEAREATIRVSLGVPSGLAVGATARSMAVPSGFVAHGGATIRYIR